jgi:hypothetical protein
MNAPITATTTAASDPIFAAIEAHAKATDEIWALSEKSLAVGPENMDFDLVQAAVVACHELDAALIDTAPTTRAGLRALDAHLRQDRHKNARWYIPRLTGKRLPPFSTHIDSLEGVDWLIAKRAAEIDSAV